MKSGSLSEQDRAVLAHIGRYRVTFKELLSYLFFDGADPQKTLDRLRSNDLIKTIKGFGGNRSAYILTKQGTRAANITSGRSRAGEQEALPIHLFILGFCFLCGRSRVRLESSELSDHLDIQAPAQHRYVLEYGMKAKRLCHLYVPDDTSTPKDIAAGTRNHIKQHRKFKGFEPWLAYRLLSFTILVDDEGRRDGIQRFLDGARDDEGRFLGQVARLDVVRVPGMQDMEEALRGLS